MTKHQVALLPCFAFAALLLLAWAPAPNRESSSIALASLTPTPTSTPQPLVTHGSRDVAEVALTFDACPGPGYDAAIVRVLTETQTPATFFLSGQWAARHMSETQALAAVPYFELGDHSWSHPHFPAIGVVWMEREITRTEQLLVQLTGRPARLFRFPYGHYSPRAIREVYRLGLTPIQWDVVSADPVRTLSAKRMTERVLSQAQNGSIVIMHVNGRGWHTAEALPGIIAGLRAKGFSLVTVSQLMADGGNSIK